MEQLKELRRRIVANGILDPDNVIELEQRLIKDSEGMTREKADFLFSLKDGLSKNKVCIEFSSFFVKAVSSYMLDDKNSPGEIDTNEAKWLRGKIQAKGRTDSTDRALLDELKKRSINFPTVLNLKGEITRRFESTLYFTRYLTLLAVFGSLASAVALFIKGSIIVINALISFFANIASPEYEKMLEMFVSSVDVFLFAMVLIIFGVGIYELFISKIDPVEQKTDGRPSWLQIRSVDDLKSSLGKVIMMVLIVTFFKYSIDQHYDNVNELLKLGVGIVLISLALYITGKSHHKQHDK